MDHQSSYLAKINIELFTITYVLMRIPSSLIRKCELGSIKNYMFNYSATAAWFIKTNTTQLTFTCSKLTIETVEQCVKYVQS